jgi:hypothetical protein
MAITYEEAIAIDPNTGGVNMDLFQQYADQQETSLANMRANPPELSAPLQTLQANPELLNQATSYVGSQGVAPGVDFQAQVEDFAVLSPEQRYLKTNPDVANFAANEFAQRGFTSDPTPYQENFAREHYYGTPFVDSYGLNEGRESFNMQRPDVNPQLMNIARITSNVVDSPGVGQNEDMMLPTYRFNSDISNPGALSDTFFDIGQNFQIRALDGYGHNMNPDMAGQDMTKFLNAAYGDRGFGYQDTLVDSLGGNGELFRAYLELGVTGAGDSYADQQMRGMLMPLLEQYGSSLGSDGNPGSTDGAGSRATDAGIMGPLDVAEMMTNSNEALPGVSSAIMQAGKVFNAPSFFTSGDPTIALGLFGASVLKNYFAQPESQRSVNNAIGQSLGFTAEDSYSPPDNNFGFTGDIDNGPLFSFSNSNSLGTPPSSANNAAGNAGESDAP